MLEKVDEKACLTAFAYRNGIERGLADIPDSAGQNPSLELPGASWVFFYFPAQMNARKSDIFTY
ncbi:MAG: hypothetical protein EA399_11235 [Desulfovibrionales bacterium]|nr:MAG: hypothetical protein EA399_11235 [Desulfovibrionales bacterium]